jgi:hypothetical protein
MADPGPFTQPVSITKSFVIELASFANAPEEEDKWVLGRRALLG